MEVEIIEWIHQTCEKKHSEDEIDLYFGLFVWPSAKFLTQFLARNLEILNWKVILELGCGPALPTIFAARHGCVKHAYATDSSRNPEVRLNVEANLRQNQLGSNASYFCLDWGLPSFSQLKGLPDGKSPDILLAADCMYEPKYYDKILGTIAFFFDANPLCVCYLSYQLRDLNDSIALLLNRWEMEAIQIDRDTFWSESDQQNRPIPSIDSLYLFRIHRTAIS
uniref:Uncharacterized protein AlNc14C57G4283 n=1 Tax=Albugo laibachii Nc14 TaxID=890382 RepID=F0WCA0_9STRA|nr:conserved hypothetical protein [Albugo laibachii Nc14]|eukprot:CCA18814.1 conserved hypothetical protein [Albugo laibachii Nc14]